MRGLSATLLLTFALSADGQPLDLAALAQTAAGDATTTFEKVRSVVAWTNRSFRWTYTDNQQRTVDEVITRQGGNCFEQAMVVNALLKELGIRTRSVREINIQPESRWRQWSARRLVSKRGASSSVFGLRHNDHVWTEFQDVETGEWLPADATLNLVGFQEWIKARAGFGARPIHPIVASRDMLVPIAILAQNGSTFEPRTDRYLIDGLNTVYGNHLETLKSWPEWTAAIAAVQPAALGAFEGKVNLHEHEAAILRARTAYENLAAEYAETGRRPRP